MKRRTSPRWPSSYPLHGNIPEQSWRTHPWFGKGGLKSGHPTCPWPASSHLLRELAAASASLHHQPPGTGERMFCNFWLELPGAEQEMSSGTRSSRNNRGSSWKLSQIRYFPLSPLPSPSTPLLFPSLLTPLLPPPAFSLALSTPLCTENFFLWVHLAPEHSSCVRLSHVTKFS